MWADARFAVRSFLKNPGFTLACVITLGLGIGANTAIFSVVDAVLLRRSPFAQIERLVMVWETDRNTATTREPGSYPDYLDIKDRARTLSSAAGLIADEMNLAPGAGDPRRVPVLRVSENLLPALGVTPLLGRTFTAEDDVPGAGGRVLISESLWERDYGRNPSAIGQTIRVDDQPYTVVGVMRQKIGIRMAVGASRSSISSLIVREGATVIAFAVGAGAAGAFLLTRLLRALLFEVSPTDPWTFLIVTALLTTVAAAATILPARRAASIDPLLALRSE